MSTAATLAHHLQAVGQVELDAVLDDYTKESLLFTQQGLLQGLGQLRAFFHAFLNNSPPELFAAFTLLRQDVAGEVAYIVWKAEPFVTLATDTFVIRDGKIVAQSFAMLAAERPA